MSRNFTIGLVKANFYALGLMFPITAIYMFLYGAFHGAAALGDDLDAFFVNPLIFLLSLVFGAVIHEVIHAVSWSWLDDIPWNNIHFGFKWKMLTPYVHCPVPVEVSHYRWGVAMPGLVLGVFPFLLSLILQNGWLLGFGFIFTIVAGGDIIMLWLLRNVKTGERVQDHPDLMGCQVINANESSDVNE